MDLADLLSQAHTIAESAGEAIMAIYARDFTPAGDPLGYATPSETLNPYFIAWGN